MGEEFWNQESWDRAERSLKSKVSGSQEEYDQVVATAKTEAEKAAADLKGTDRDRVYWDTYYDYIYKVFRTREPLDDPRYGYREGQVRRSENIDEEFVEVFDLLDTIFKNREVNTDYNFFKEPQAREELFAYTKALAEHLRGEKIQNLVIIDRAARPIYVALLEYFRSKYPDEKRPNIYFMNPRGFMNRQDESSKEAVDEASHAISTGDRAENPMRVRDQQTVQDEFERTYKSLLDNKDEPVMVFDTCIHTGDAMERVARAFKEGGFSDLRIGSINPPDFDDSKVKADFFITRQRPRYGCFPFDKDRIIEKTFDHVFSYPTSDKERRAKSIQLRGEIQRIMREHLQ